VLGSALAVGAARAVSWLVRKADSDVTYYTSSAVDGLEYLMRKADDGGLRIPAEARELALDLDVFARRAKDPSALVSEHAD
jgi:hypothetical protein